MKASSNSLGSRTCRACLQGDAERPGRHLHLVHMDCGDGGVVGTIHEYSHMREVGHRLPKDLQPFSMEL